MTMPLRRTLIALGLALAAAWPLAGQADTWPSRPLKLYVPYPPGGAADAVGRIYAEKLGEALKQPVVVENKPGAGTAIAAEAAAKSPADGYTLSLTPAGQLTILPHLAKKLNYDPFTSFAPVSLLAATHVVIAAHPSVPANNFKELVALAKANPGKLSYSSSGNGTITHLTGEYFKLLTGTDLLHVPYKGSAPAVTALLGGEVNLAFDTLTVLAPQIKAGKAKGVAIASRERSPLLPGVGTGVEAGYKEFETLSWFGLVVPAGTPRDIIKRLHDEIVAIAKQRSVQEKLAAQGLEAMTASPEQFTDRIKAEYARNGKIVQASGATLD